MSTMPQTRWKAQAELDRVQTAQTMPPSAAIPKARRRRIAFALIVLAIAAVHPPQGLGIDICPPRIVTGLSCPGCGITRSISCTIRGMFAEAVAFNPFGPVLIIAAIVIGASALLPGRWKARIARRFTWAENSADRMLWILTAAFIAFGLLRAGMQFALPQHL